MRLTFIILCITFMLSACRNDYKLCEHHSADEKVNIYNDILNELVEHYFYNFYLGEDEEQIFKAYLADNPDTTKIKSDIIQLQNKLFDDTARFCNIYLDTVYRPYFFDWIHYQNDTQQFARELKELFTGFSNDGQSIIDSLNNMEKDLKPSDFHLCTSKIRSVGDTNSQQNPCDIGRVSFSKVFLDKTKTKGLLYCNFRCGRMCGFGRLLFIEKLNDRWSITYSIRTWVS